MLTSPGHKEESILEQNGKLGHLTKSYVASWLTSGLPPTQATRHQAVVLDEIAVAKLLL